MPAGASSEWFEGRVESRDGLPIVGALVTLESGDPAYALTVYSDAVGRYRTPLRSLRAADSLRVRRLGYRDLLLQPAALDAAPAPLVLEREDDPVELAAQLPANRWYQLVLERLDDPAEREEFTRQCTYCHQQGSWATRRVRDEETWSKLIELMGRMGATLSRDLREKLPGVLMAAWDPATAVPALTARMHEPDFAPPPAHAALGAVIEEWQLGGLASMQHDLMVHRDGRVYSVDMMQDQLYRLDPAQPGGARRSWTLPAGELPLGGVFAGLGSPLPPNSNARVGPHSLQGAPDGSIWITLALGNQLARFDPETESFSTVALEEGFYPHTLRFDQRGRIWYSIAASNHMGMYDTTTGERRALRLPARTWGQAAAARMLPFFLWLGRHVDLQGAVAGGEGLQAPVPYGVDVGPDGAVWFSQLNEHRIGRIDPESFELELVDTPFTAPRRMRFDSRGRLWIPGFSANTIARFDPATREFKSWELPIEPIGTETPYALNVDRRTDAVWICGTNSDTLIRFEPEAERFTVYPLPTRVTYTREIDFDEHGRVWTSNSNLPTWQIEGAHPRVLRLDPSGSAPIAPVVAHARALAP